MCKIKITAHYLARFSERVSKKSRRPATFAERAMDDGDDVDSVKDKRLYNYIMQQQEKHDMTTAKLYHGFIYIFVENRVVTVFALPKSLRKAAI